MRINILLENNLVGRTVKMVGGLKVNAELPSYMNRICAVKPMVTETGEIFYRLCLFDRSFVDVSGNDQIVFEEKS